MTAEPPLMTFIRRLRDLENRATPPPWKWTELVGKGRTSPDDAKLVARDDKKNPLISTFEWTADATQRILRVPAGFMRNKTQERIEELARARAASTIDLALVEEGIELGKKMMAEMIATYDKGTGRPNLNEVSPITMREH